MIIFDKMPAGSTRRRTGDGYLVAQAHIAKVGVQTYLGNEVGRPGAGIVRVYRPAAEVFDRASLTSFAHKPITVGHPPEGVTADNWKRRAVGYVGGEVLRDGDRIAVPLLFTDSAAIRQLESGVQELSGGYGCDLDWTPGVTADGEAYDAVQRQIRINHVALVAQGRAGSTIRVGDAAYGGQQMNQTMNDSQQAYRQYCGGLSKAHLPNGGRQKYAIPDEMVRTMRAQDAAAILPILAAMNDADSVSLQNHAAALHRHALQLKAIRPGGYGMVTDTMVTDAVRLGDHCLGLVAVARAAA